MGLKPVTVYARLTTADVEAVALFRYDHFVVALCFDNSTQVEKLLVLAHSPAVPESELRLETLESLRDHRVHRVLDGSRLLLPWVVPLVPEDARLRNIVRLESV